MFNPFTSFGSPKNVMAEKDIVTAILRYLKSVPRCFAWKEHGGMYGTAGIPDIIACIDGRFFAFEVKTAAGRATPLQNATILKILSSGGIASVARSLDEVQAVLRESGIALRNDTDSKTPASMLH